MVPSRHPSVQDDDCCGSNHHGPPTAKEGEGTAESRHVSLLACNRDGNLGFGNYPVVGLSWSYAFDTDATDLFFFLLVGLVVTHCVYQYLNWLFLIYVEN
mgnify:CR=1 FL=1